MLKIGVLVSGGGTNLQAIIDRVNSRELDNVEISIVISNNKKAYALERAKENNIKAKAISPKDYTTRQEYSQQMIKELKENKVDLVVLAGFLVVLEQDFIKEFCNKIINVHPSLIPAFCGKGYYGIKVHEGVIERGVKYTGATVHFVDEGTDTGPIIMQKVIEVKDSDTPSVLQKRVMEEVEWDILPKVIKLISEDRVLIKGNRVEIKEENK